MYSTKPLSVFKSNQEASSWPPPPLGQNSGYLVVQGAGEDENDDETCCWRWGQCGESRNRVLTVQYSQSQSTGKSTSYHGKRTSRSTAYHSESTSYTEEVVFVPVPDQPLSSNRYYAVIASGKHKGLVRACSREEDMSACCFCRCIKDVKPRPFDPTDIYQQMEVVRRRRGQFTAKAVAPDGFPSYLYRQKYWTVQATKPKSFALALGDAPGLNAAQRSRVLDSASPITPTTVGRWYCPFYLVKEDGVSPSAQMDRAAFYEVVLEQRWEPVHDGTKLSSKTALIGGNLEARLDVPSRSRQSDGYVWVRAAAGQRVGVCASVWEKMLWEEYRGGWVDEEEEAGKVTMAGELVLAERFVVKRTDGSAAVAFDFVHLNKVRGKQV
ncbi:hypothetical protein BRADI_3g35752v3 [Brachypodium distachyon]|uniref:Insecticidal crystal toxin domain-containing protein n=1 Tax=Brachypodium distachyon TaxID=15368 RepID=A0A0Q3ICY4_BRADI|nr:hypothetical protein BRADI_3g35752v3 [Brachypodium distachyon]